MKSLLTPSTFGFLALCLAALPWPARAQTDITGAWIVTVNSPLGQASVDTTFTQTGEKIAGVVNGPTGGVNFSGTVIKNELAVLYPLPLQGQMFEVRMTGVVEPERMSGVVNLGGIAQATWSAKRKPPTGQPVDPSATPAAAAAVDLTNVSGTWNIQVRLGALTLPMTGTLAQSGESVSGTIRTPVGDVPATGRFADAHLTLQFTAQTPQGAVPVTLNGELTAHGLAGTSSAVGLSGSAWSATRAE